MPCLCAEVPLEAPLEKTFKVPIESLANGAIPHSALMREAPVGVTNSPVTPLGPEKQVTN